jgi:hypothetical protein
MTTVHPEWYWDVANQLGALSVKLEQELHDLDTHLDVARSAGVHTTAGTGWAAAYDQSGADIFELTGLCAMAAGNFATMVYTAGKNHVEAENKSAPGKPQIPIPAAPGVTSLEGSYHPSELSSGGLGDTPGRWPIIDGHHKKTWADCDTGKIARAGQLYDQFANVFTNVVLTLPSNPDEPEDVPQIRSAAQMLLTAVNDIGFFSKCLSQACQTTASYSASERDSIKSVLFYCDMTIKTWTVTSWAPRLLWFTKELIKKYIEQLKVRAGQDVDTLLTELDGYVSGAIQTTGGSTSGATGDAQLYLAPFLGRYARQGYPVTGRRLFDNIRAGRQGEIRAGINPNAPKRAIQMNGNRRIPDRIDDANRQVTEVKNVNDAGRWQQQIQDETDWAEKNGYTMTLIVDSRTQLSQGEQQLADQGKITVIREELDNNIPKGQQATPFIPRQGWGPPTSNKDPRGATGIPTP